MEAHGEEPILPLLVIKHDKWRDENIRFYVEINNLTIRQLEPASVLGKSPLMIRLMMKNETLSQFLLAHQHGNYDGCELSHSTFIVFYFFYSFLGWNIPWRMKMYGLQIKWLIYGSFYNTFVLTRPNKKEWQTKWGGRWLKQPFDKQWHQKLFGHLQILLLHNNYLLELLHNASYYMLLIPQ